MTNVTTGQLLNCCAMNIQTNFPAIHVAGGDSIVIKNCHALDNGNFGFNLGCTNSTVEDCVASNNRALVNGAGESGFILSGASLKTIVKNCLATGNGGPGFHINASDVTVQNCVAEDNGVSTLAGSAASRAGFLLIGGGINKTGILLENNIANSNVQYGVRVSAGLVNSNIVNNKATNTSEGADALEAANFSFATATEVTANSVTANYAEKSADGTTDRNYETRALHTDVGVEVTTIPLVIHDRSANSFNYYPNSGVPTSVDFSTMVTQWHNWSSVTSITP